ncbi:hypothetical protein [Tenacibaculum crassostreae]|uniref:hypothetical protein n=1 Tax=Tenacibaculum crassostreae TaxID=502683 RepID=UPI003895D31B
MKNKILKLFPVLFAILLLVYVFYNNNRRETLLKKGETVYTLGTTTQLKSTSRSGLSIYYNFFLANDNKKIEARTFFDIKDAKKPYVFIKEKYIGKIFFVKYSKEKPIYSEIYFDKPVPDSLSNCTNCYWEKPPW